MEVLTKTKKHSQNPKENRSNKRPSSKISTMIPDKILALTQSWKCCSCRTENYNNKWKCSWCGHERCNSCKELMG